MSGLSSGSSGCKNGFPTISCNSSTPSASTALMLRPSKHSTFHPCDAIQRLSSTPEVSGCLDRASASLLMVDPLANVEILPPSHLTLHVGCVHPTSRTVSIVPASNKEISNPKLDSAASHKLTNALVLKVRCHDNAQSWAWSLLASVPANPLPLAMHSAFDRLSSVFVARAV